jgi:cysteine desulfurase
MPTKPAILLDSNAGAPLRPVVTEALLAFLSGEQAPAHGQVFAANPSSTHAFGRKATTLITEAKAAILKTLHASPTEWGVTFTSGGTEANQLAVRTALAPGLLKGSRPKWAASEVEHSCVLDYREVMTRAGAEVRSLPTERNGEVRQFPKAEEEINLISVIGVGNETGILHHTLTSHILSGNYASTKQRSALHIDFVAGWGKAKLDLSAPNAPDLVAIAGHKLGALPGTGALVHRKSFSPVRAGTPNLTGILAMKAIADHWSEIEGEEDRLRELRDSFENRLLEAFPKTVIVGKDLPRAPQVSNFYFPGLPKDMMLVPHLDLQGFAVSSGSACASQIPEPSHVLLAMGVSKADARNALRVSLHTRNTADDLNRFFEALAAILRRYEFG